MTDQPLYLVLVGSGRDDEALRNVFGRWAT
jgi:hypothetical protein